MVKLTRSAVLIASLAAMLGVDALAGRAEAQGVFTQPIYSRVYAITPRCRPNPDYPVIGRVAGYVSAGQSSRLSWVGCFPSMRECEAWRRIARGEINPPIQQNRCEPRF